MTKKQRYDKKTQKFQYVKWQEYFRLQPRDYFGGRVLFSARRSDQDSPMFDSKDDENDCF
jgi:hypothetical protein